MTDDGIYDPYDMDLDESYGQGRCRQLLDASLQSFCQNPSESDDPDYQSSKQIRKGYIR